MIHHGFHGFHAGLALLECHEFVNDPSTDSQVLAVIVLPKEA
jgi:hypothetical protein